MTTATVHRLDLGAYEAPRAAALAGVPERTLYEWSNTDLVVPSVAGRQKLWSYSDLLTLRLVRWLRTEKLDVARTKMAEVRRMLDEMGDDLWTVGVDGRDVPTIRVTPEGDVIRVDLMPGPANLDGQHVFDDVIDLFAPPDAIDLRRPRPHLRIVPGRVSGEPHLLGSRLSTQNVAGLAHRGMNLEAIAALYPHEDPVALDEAIDLETELAAA